MSEKKFCFWGTKKRMLTFLKIGSIYFSKGFDCTSDKKKPLSLEKEGDDRTSLKTFL